MGATAEIDFKQMAKNILAAYQRDIDQGYEPSPCGKQVQIIAQAYLDQCQEVDRLKEALQRISDGTDAPDIDISGEWQTGLHCGVEDRDCQDRYEGADYGYSQGVERTLEWAGNEADYALKEQQ